MSWRRRRLKEDDEEEDAVEDVRLGQLYYVFDVADAG